MPSLDRQPDNTTDTNAPPANFDARQYPVIGQHYFGIAPPRPWPPLNVVLARAGDQPSSRRRPTRG